MRLHFIGKKQESGDIWSFSFMPNTPLAWVAGQSLRLEIAGPYGPLEHRFSIASAPSSGTVTVTTRLTGSDYKESLAALQPGDAAEAHGLEGDFVWREHDAPHIFVAAGIGITPLRAIIAERMAQGLAVRATLLYSSRDEPMVYAHELKQWHRHDAELAVHFLQNQRISTADILAQPQARERLIYISGPSKMVDALGTDLLAAGIPPAHMLRDQFTGRLSEDG